jgi:hypothetical protein
MKLLTKFKIKKMEGVEETTPNSDDFTEEANFEADDDHTEDSSGNCLLAIQFTLFRYQIYKRIQI